jgi:hypothetical protein
MVSLCSWHLWCFPEIVSIFIRPSPRKRLNTNLNVSTARIRRLGVRNLQADDFLMVNALVWYTILCVALNQVASGGGSNLMTEEEKKTLTPAIHAERERGSKWVFVSEHAFILTVWSLKSCMLVIYARITYANPHSLFGARLLTI